MGIDVDWGGVKNVRFIQENISAGNNPVSGSNSYLLRFNNGSDNGADNAVRNLEFEDITLGTGMNWNNVQGFNQSGFREPVSYSLTHGVNISVTNGSSPLQDSQLILNGNVSTAANKSFSIPIDRRFNTETVDRVIETDPLSQLSITRKGVAKSILITDTSSGFKSLQCTITGKSSL